MSTIHTALPWKTWDKHDGITGPRTAPNVYWDEETIVSTAVIHELAAPASALGTLASLLDRPAQQSCAAREVAAADCDWSTPWGRRVGASGSPSFVKGD